MGLCLLLVTCTAQFKHGSKLLTILPISTGAFISLISAPIKAYSTVPFNPFLSVGEKFHADGGINV